MSRTPRMSHKQDYGQAFASYHGSMARAARESVEFTLLKLRRAGVEITPQGTPDAFEVLIDQGMRRAMTLFFCDVVHGLAALYRDDARGNEKLGELVRGFVYLWNNADKSLWATNDTIGQIVEIIENGGRRAKV